MALHEANQARSSHYLQWHCGPKLHLLATNDIPHLLGKQSTTWPQRAHHHLSGHCSVVLPRYRLVPCKHLFKKIFKRKNAIPKLRTSHDKSLSQPGCSHSNTIYDVQLQKTIVLRTGLQNTIELCATVSEIAPPKPDGSRRQSRKKTILKHFLKGFLKGKLLPWKLRESTRKSLSQPGCSHSNTIYDVQLQKTTLLRMQPRQRATLSTQGVVLRLSPQNIAHQQSCTHFNAICNHSFRKRIELRTQEQPLVAKHIEGTNRVRNDRSRTRRTHEVPFIVACSHFTRKNTRFRAPASSPKHGPRNIHAAIPMRSATAASGNA